MENKKGDSRERKVDRGERKIDMTKQEGSVKERKELESAKQERKFMNR